MTLDLLIHALALGIGNAAIVVLISKSKACGWLRRLDPTGVTACGFCVSWWSAMPLIIFTGGAHLILWPLTVALTAPFVLIIVDTYGDQK